MPEAALNGIMSDGDGCSSSYLWFCLNCPYSWINFILGEDIPMIFLYAFECRKGLTAWWHELPRVLVVMLSDLAVSEGSMDLADIADFAFCFIISSDFIELGSTGDAY